MKPQTANRKPQTKIIVKGNVEGEALVSKSEISFFGGVDAKTGKIIEKGHELFNQSIKDKILIFPNGKGSTVGSYVIYALKKNNCAPKAIVVEKAEPIIVVGCVLAEIPLIEIKNLKSLNIKTGDYVKINVGEIIKL